MLLFYDVYVMKKGIATNFDKTWCRSVFRCDLNVDLIYYFNSRRRQPHLTCFKQLNKKATFKWTLLKKTTCLCAVFSIDYKHQ